MGLLDSINFGSQGGYGGLLDMLMYRSPQAEPVQGPQYDQMGVPFAAAPQADTSPFGPLPNPPSPAMYRLPSVFNNGAASVAGMAPVNAQPVQQPPVLPPQAPTDVSAQNVQPLRTLDIGGYKMPQFGPLADYTPQAPTDVSAQARQPMQPEGPQQALPPAFGNGSTLGRLFNPDGLVARLTGNDSRSLAQQNLKAKYENYVANGLTHSQAMLAALNPKASEIADQRILEKKQYGFTKLDNDTIVRTDPLTGKAEIAYGGGDANKTGVAGPDGKIIPYPEGLDSAGKKTFANEIARINADAAAGKKTEVQAKSEKFGNKMELAERNLKGLEGEGTSLFGQIASNVPLGNYAQSPQYQKYSQAKNNFITALLRDESGAAIGTQEFLRYERELFPQPGDSPAVIRQKAEARSAATEAMKKSAGPGYKSPASSDLPSGWSVSVR